LQYRHNR